MAIETNESRREIELPEPHEGVEVVSNIPEIDPPGVFVVVSTTRPRYRVQSPGPEWSVKRTDGKFYWVRDPRFPMPEIDLEKLKAAFAEGSTPGPEADNCSESMSLLWDSILPLISEVEKLRLFKEYTHGYLDKLGASADPDPKRTEETGCRMGTRFEWVVAEIELLRRQVKGVAGHIVDAGRERFAAEEKLRSERMKFAILYELIAEDAEKVRAFESSVLKWREREPSVAGNEASLPALISEVERLRAALRKQHEWHLNQIDHDEMIGESPAAAYGDSALYEQTIAALNPESEAKKSSCIFCLEPTPATKDVGGPPTCDRHAADLEDGSLIVEPDRIERLKLTCECELRDRQWNGYGKCETCGRRFVDQRKRVSDAG